MGVCGAGKTQLVPLVLALCILLPVFCALNILPTFQTAQVFRGIARADGWSQSRSYSRLLAYESARILFRLGCDVRIFDPRGLPVKDDEQHMHPKVQELRELSKWSDGHVWVSPEQHGNLVSSIPSLRPCRLGRTETPGVYTQELMTTLPRPASSSSRLTGSLSPRARSDLPRAVRWPSRRYAVGRNLSTPSTHSESWGGGCACLPSPTRARCRAPTRSLPPTWKVAG